MRLSYLLFILLWPMLPWASDHQELLNEEERQWLEGLSKPLIVGTEANYHPYNFVNENGEMDGVSGDYVRLLEHKLEVRFEVREYPTFTDLLEAAKNREIDMIPALIAAPERKAYFDFTQPVFATQDRIFTRQEMQANLSLDDLGGVRVGVVDGYALQAVIERDYPGIVLVPAADEPEGLLALSLGRVDAFISEIGTSSYYIQQQAITNLRVAGVVDQVDQQTFGTRNDWPILNRIVGKGLASITPEEHAEIQRRWINISGVDPLELELLSQRVTTVAGFIVILLVFVLGWIFSLRRLVARRTAELQQELAERRVLEAERARLAVAVAQSAEFVVVIDADGNIEYANQAFTEALDLPRGQGQQFGALAAKESQIIPSEAVQGAHQQGGWRGQIVLTAGHDRPMKVEMNIVPIYDDNADIDGYVATGRDVTNEELLEARLRQGERLSALGTLAGGIAHDFNNLLVPILGNVDLIRANAPAELGPMLDGISDAGERARDLVQRIMIFGRGSQGEMHPLDLRYEIEDAIAFIKHLVPKTITLESELSPCGTVLGDRTQVQQILMNLCSNASDAMAADGGTLKIELEPYSTGDHPDIRLPELPVGDYALLTVSDTGIGMSKETLARIFDPYFSDKQQASGTGLGLAIVHGVVVRHNGYIYVDSTPNAGTRFRIFLLAAAGDVPEQVDNNGAAACKSSGGKVLLVDDDPLVLGTVRNMLMGLGYEVEGWSDAAAALEAFSAAPLSYDALLSDLTMPGLTGLQLLEQAVAIRPDLPVAIMTGNTEAIRDTAFKRISKPMQLAELSDCMQTLITPATTGSA